MRSARGAGGTPRLRHLGSVDFIYSGGTAVFDRCDITQRREEGGPLTAPSTL